MYRCSKCERCSSTHIHMCTAPLHRLKQPTLRKTYWKSLHLHRPQSMVSYHDDLCVAQATMTAVTWMDLTSPSPHAPTAPPGANPTETQAQTPDATGPPIRNPIPMATALPTQSHPIDQMPPYGAPGGGYPPGPRQPYPPHHPISMGQHFAYTGPSGMVGGASAAYSGQGQGLTQWHRPPCSEWCVCVCVRACVCVCVGTF